MMFRYKKILVSMYMHFDVLSVCERKKSMFEPLISYCYTDLTTWKCLVEHCMIIVTSKAQKPYRGTIPLMHAILKIHSMKTFWEHRI